MKQNNKILIIKIFWIYICLKFYFKITNNVNLLRFKIVLNSSLIISAKSVMIISMSKMVNVTNIQKAEYKIAKNMLAKMFVMNVLKDIFLT